MTPSPTPISLATRRRSGASACGRRAIRVIAIRRDLDRTPEEALQLFYVVSGAGGERVASWTRRVATLRAAVEASAALPALDGDDDWEAHHRPLVLVCTNGRHDPCCATFGRPLVRILRESHRRDDVWECSHIGGDRFAANVVILPEGLYFGRCDGSSAVQLLDAYERGDIDLDHYRGRSVFGFLEQAADFFVRGHLGISAIDAVTAVRRRDGAAGVIDVDVVTADDQQRTIAVTVSRTVAPASTALTCTGPTGLRLPSYRLVAIEPVTS